MKHDSVKNRCHGTLKNVQTFWAEPFISVKKPIVASWHDGLLYTDEGLCPKRLYMFNDTKSFPLTFSCFYSVTHCSPIFRLKIGGL